MNQNTRACRIEYGVISFLDFNKLQNLAHKYICKIYSKLG